MFLIIPSRARKRPLHWLTCGLLSILAGLLFLDNAFAHGGGGGGGGGHGGGHTTTTIIIVPGGGAAVPLFRGSEAAMALEISDAPVSADQGLMRQGDVIAVHTLRSADAVVLSEPIKGRRREVPVGTVLVRAEFADPGQKIVLWCDIRPTDRPFWPQEHDCFEDTQHTGKLDKIREADMSADFLGFALSGIGDYGDPPPTPAAYRPATPQERPLATLGFKYCDGDGIQSPPRFAMVVTAPSQSDAKVLTGSCRFGIWADSSKKTVDLGFMKLDVTPAADGALHYHLVSRIEPERLARLYKMGAVQDASKAAPADLQRRAADLLRRQSTLAPTGVPPTVAWGPVQVGQVFVTIAVKHNLTGVLLNRVSRKMFGIAGAGFEPGQILFAVPAASADLQHMTWCAPVKGPQGANPLVTTATCLYPAESGYILTENKTPAMAPFAIVGYGGMPVSSDPSVRVQPVDFPPMTATYRLTEVSMDNAGLPAPVFHVEIDADWGEGPQMVAKETYELPPKGKVIKLAGTSILLQRDGTTLEILHDIP